MAVGATVGTAVEVRDGVLGVSTVGAVVGFETGAVVGIRVEVGTAEAVESGTAVASSEQAEITRTATRRQAITFRAFMVFLRRLPHRRC